MHETEPYRVDIGLLGRARCMSVRPMAQWDGFRSRSALCGDVAVAGGFHTTSQPLPTIFGTGTLSREDARGIGGNARLNTWRISRWATGGALELDRLAQKHPFYGQTGRIASASRY